MKTLIALFGLFIGCCLAQFAPCTFDGWIDVRSECTDGVTECTDCNSKLTCQQRCLTKSTCMGYEFLEYSRRCAHYFPSICSTQYANIVQYKMKSCREEMQLDESTNPGFSSRKAVAGRNEHFRGCPLDCGNIPYVMDALHNGKNVDIGSAVTYFCKKGFKLRGKRTIKCNENGEWDEAPVCEFVERHD